MFCLRVKDFPHSRAFLFAPRLLFKFGEVCSFCLLPFFEVIVAGSFFFFWNFETKSYVRTKAHFPKCRVFLLETSKQSRTYVRKWAHFLVFPSAEWIFSTLIMSTHATSMGSKLVMVKRFSRVDTHDSLLSRMLWGLSHVLYYLKFRFTDFAS